MSPPRSYVVGAGSGQDLLASAATTAGALTVARSRIGAGPPRHVHAHEGECLFVLAGELVVECDAEILPAGPHGFVFLPRGLPHTFRAADGHADVLLLAVPGGIEQAGDVATQVRVGEKHGIRLV